MDPIEFTLLALLVGAIAILLSCGPVCVVIALENMERLDG